MKTTHYDGTFELAFLRDDKQVRSVGDGTGAVEVITPDETIRVNVGDWLARTPLGRVIIYRTAPTESGEEVEKK